MLPAPNVRPLDTDLTRLQEQRTIYESRRQAPATAKSYAEGWRHFCGWCARMGFDTALPCAGENVSLYVCAMRDAGLSAGTIQMRVTAVAQMHKQLGHASPVNDSVRAQICGARRAARPGGKAALSPDHLRLMLSELETTPKLNAIRNKALLLLGFASAMRRSELIGLDLQDIEFVSSGRLLVSIRRGKTDQEWQGRDIGIFAATDPRLCPLRALSAWLEKRGTFDGPLFPRLVNGVTLTACRLSGPMVNILVKRLAAKVGLNEKRFGSHSMRIGFVTTAIQAGVSVVAIQLKTGHVDLKMIRRYARPASAFSIDPKVL